jgi:hypothetical protein
MQDEEESAGELEEDEESDYFGSPDGTIGLRCEECDYETVLAIKIWNEAAQIFFCAECEAPMDTI